LHSTASGNTDDYVDVIQACRPGQEWRAIACTHPHTHA